MRTIQGFTLFHSRWEALSNWFLSDFVIRDKKYNCVEQRIMFAKAKLFGDEEIAAMVMATPSPKKQKELGRLVQGFDEKVWVAKRGPIAMQALYAKFSQNEPDRAVLLGTGSTRLVEASGTDVIWGVGLKEDDPLILDPANWRGLGLLGPWLEAVRERLKTECNA